MSLRKEPVKPGKPWSCPLLGIGAVWLLVNHPYDSPRPIALESDKRVARRLIAQGLLEKDPSGQGYRCTDEGRSVVNRYRQLGWLDLFVGLRTILRDEGNYGRTELPRDSSEEETFAVESFLFDAQEVIAETMQSRAVTKSELAQRLGVTPPRVARMLAGNANITLRTLARVFFALGEECVLAVRTAAERTWPRATPGN